MSKLTLRKSDALDDWYVIELAEHDNSYGLKPMNGGAVLTYSGRISDADVEGTAEDMLLIAQAILAGGSFAARRCAVETAFESDRVSFWSPRNSQTPGRVTKAEAAELAREIIRTLGAPT